MTIETLLQLKQIVNQLTYKDQEFRIGELGDGFFIQVRFYAQDLNTNNIELQSGRKWYISKFMTKSEIVQTAFQACLKAEEHECRENFKYQDEQVFCPHYSIDELYEFSKNSSRDSRSTLETTAIKAEVKKKRLEDKHLEDERLDRIKDQIKNIIL